MKRFRNAVRHTLGRLEQQTNCENFNHVEAFHTSLCYLFVYLSSLVYLFIYLFTPLPALGGRRVGWLYLVEDVKMSMSAVWW